MHNPCVWSYFGIPQWLKCQWAAMGICVHLLVVTYTTGTDCIYELFFYSTVQKSTTMMKVPLYAWLLHIWSHLSQIFCFQTKTDSYKHHDNYKKTHSLEFQDISLRSIDVTLCNCHYSKYRAMWWEWLVCLQHVTQCYFKMGLVQGGIVKGMMGSGLWMAEAEWQL